MSTFPSSSQAGAYEARLAVTSNPFMAEGQNQQPSAGGAAAPLHPSHVLYAHNSLAEAALYETLTPLPSPPLSMLGQPQDDKLTRYRANDGFTPGNGPAAQQRRLPAGTWAADVTTGDVFAGDAVRLAPPHNSPQVFRSAPGTPDVAHSYRGSFLDHRQLPSALQQKANSCFYGWPTPPVENGHLMSWCVDHTGGQPENYPLSVHLAAQLEGTSSRTPFRGPAARQQGGSYLGLYAPSSVTPAQLGIHGVSEQGHYYQPDLQMDGGIAAETIASIAQEQLAHDRYQQTDRTKLHLATGRQQVPQPPDAVQSQQAAACYRPPSGLEHSTPPRPKLTTTFWEEERTTCYQVDAHGVCVARRKGTDPLAFKKGKCVRVGARRSRRGLYFTDEESNPSQTTTW
ncbi:MAG: hypothetical protein BJ554DRAFT_5910 [Olpidium bornovanus]|uniref:Uncharacterized protein n=1 Tax=Olpidium bornovanus TaxID=278681 RepID=A0A8H7ZZH2_9FUNG|nr:MAG: hypothetical protein BJ554DRAFT_5910 [Olpidium bornovanus]